MNALGVDVSVARGLDLVLLDADRRVLVQHARRSPEDLRAFLLEHRPDVVVIDSPPSFGTTGNSRLVERELIRRNVQVFRTPSAPQDIAKGWYDWMRAGHDAFAAAAAAGYPLYTEGPSVHRTAVETYPHAVAVVLKGMVPPPGVSRSGPLKRAWRVAVLADQGVDISTLRTTDEIDAALCSLTGLMALDGCFVVVGDPTEGTMVLPCHQLPDRYMREAGGAAPRTGRSSSSRRDALARAIVERARLSGTFTLRSGQTSGTYFDKYMFEADAKLLREVAKAMAALVPSDTDALAGLELGGIPVATMLSQVTGIPTRFVRKQAKGYGTMRLAEGGEVAGLKLVVVEDVVTTGGQIVESVGALRDAGAVVETVVCVIDREQGGAANLESHGLTLRSLFRRADLDAIDAPSSDGEIANLLTDDLREAMRGLSDADRRVLELRFGLVDGRPRTLAELADEFGITRDQAREAESRARARLRDPDRS